MATAVASWLWRPPQRDYRNACGFSLNRAGRFRCCASRSDLHFHCEFRRSLLIPCRAAPENKEDASNEEKAEDDPDPAPGTLEDPQEPAKFITGSPLPGLKAPRESVKIPRDVLEIIRNQVFGFDTFFATSQEYYEAGVIFRGNMRGEPSASYAKLDSRMQDKFGDEYKLFLILDPQGDKPAAAVVRNLILQPEKGAVPEWFTITAFGVITLVTLVLRNSPILQLTILSGKASWDQVWIGFPGLLVVASVLLGHELGHFLAAKRNGATLSLPYFIPSWQLGSFGGITRIVSVLKDRTQLIEIAAAGPIAGALIALTFIIVGLLVPPQPGQGLTFNSALFHDSLLVGGIAKAILGDLLKEGSSIQINPVVLSAWQGLLITALNSIPIGELDGGRIANGIWGRKTWARFTGVSLGLLAVGGFLSDIALYWVVLVIVLQRGPLPPQANEITPPSTKHVIAGVSVLLLSLLVCCPFPFSF